MSTKSTGVVCGVCAYISNKYDIDVVFVRFLMAFFMIGMPLMFFVYLIVGLGIPKGENDDKTN